MKAGAAITAVIACAWCVLVLTTACSGITQPQDVVFPDSNISYLQHMQPFLNLSCANGGCHDKTQRSGDIDLTDYTGLMFTSRPNLAVPGKPEESLIINSLEQRITHPYDIMSRVTDNQRRGVRRWILEGAKAN